MPDTDTGAVREGTVADIPDAVLIERACRGIPVRGRFSGQPRWSFIGSQFGLGCTYAHQLCKRFGLDPDERVRRAP